MLLNQFKQQAGSDWNLSDPQTEALLTFMKEEKSVAASSGLPLGESGQDPAKLQAMMSGDKVEQYMQPRRRLTSGSWIVPEPSSRPIKCRWLEDSRPTRRR